MTTLTTKSIKDYLPFYLGAQVTLKVAWLHLIHQGYEDGRYNLTADILHKILIGGFDFESIELRNLSDMTEEEKLEVFKILFGDDGFNAMRLRFRVALDSLSPEAVRYLLSKQFDLYNLIPEGLAIDKQTLKQS